ncbi:hypothetical protein STEG23_009215 [Scotinomys teguina]
MSQQKELLDLREISMRMTSVEMEGGLRGLMYLFFQVKRMTCIHSICSYLNLSSSGVLVGCKLLEMDIWREEYWRKNCDLEIYYVFTGMNKAGSKGGTSGEENSGKKAGSGVTSQTQRTQDVKIPQKDWPCFRIHSVNLCLFIGCYGNSALNNRFSFKVVSSYTSSTHTSPDPWCQRSHPLTKPTESKAVTFSPTPTESKAVEDCGFVLRANYTNKIWGVVLVFVILSFLNHYIT